MWLTWVWLAGGACSSDSADSVDAKPGQGAVDGASFDARFADARVDVDDANEAVDTRDGVDATPDAQLADAADPCANLLVNGGFELPKISANTDAYSTSSSTFLPGWVIVAGGNEFFLESGEPFAGYIRHEEGVQAVCLNGDGAANVSVSQAFTTAIGHMYTLRFAMSDEHLDAFPATTLKIDVGDLSQTVTRDQQGGWVVKTLSFTALAATTTLTIKDVSTNVAFNESPFLDDVSVSACTP